MLKVTYQAIPYDDSTFDYVLTNFQLQFLPTPELAMIGTLRQNFQATQG